MAVTQNTYTGDGSTVLFSFTFPYLNTTDIKVSLDDVDTSAYTLANATTIQFNTAPANGVAIRIYRVTDDAALAAEFFPGSAIRAQDLNDNFTQNLYVTQESNRDVAVAVSDIGSAVTAANTAISTANTANATANTAASDASNAVSTANTALSAANNAVNTANTANSTAGEANVNALNALNAVSDALLFTSVANVAAIPASPNNGDAVRVFDSTGIESFTPLNNIPVGFVGSSELNVEIFYISSSSSWVWNRYFPNDPETRYLKTGAGTVTTTNISDNSITSVKLASGAAISNIGFTPLSAAAGSVGTSNLAAGAVGTSNLADGAVTALKATVASQAQAEAGSDSSTLMTPQRVAQAISALAGGGSVVTTTFTSSGTFTKNAADLFYFVHVIGGGGANSNEPGYPNPGAGGGAGFFGLILPSQLSSSTSVTIGAGGTNSGNGGDTVFGFITATGGQGAWRQGIGNGGWVFPNQRLPSGSFDRVFAGGTGNYSSSVFGGGGSAASSLFAGNGGATDSNGVIPGGAGGPSTIETNRDGARGEVRVYAIRA